MSLHLFIHSSKLTAILGISAFYHDSAAALIVNGEIIAAGASGVYQTKNLCDLGGIQKISDRPIAIHSEWLLLISSIKFNKKDGKSSI